MTKNLRERLRASHVELQLRSALSWQMEGARIALGLLKEEAEKRAYPSSADPNCEPTIYLSDLTKIIEELLNGK